MPTGIFDGEGFFAALDAERQSRGLTWKKVAEQSEVQASTLTRMSQGRRPDVDSLAALCQWSGLSADIFSRGAHSQASAPSPLAQITTLLRADPNLSEEGVKALDAVIRSVYGKMRNRKM